MVTERSLHELYADDPERADALAFGRRDVLKGTALATLGAVLGTAIPFARTMPPGLLPAAFAQAPTTGPAASAPPPAGPAVLRMDGKAALILLAERPLNAETPETMLDDDVTPADKFFIRNNGLIPDAAADPKAWRIKVEGEVGTPLDLSLGDLESRFPLTTLRLQMECGGNGRGAFAPETRGNQWGNGAISNGEWTGVRLRDLLAAASPTPSARFTGHYGADPHLSGDLARPSISRGMPIDKAMDEHTFVATRLNGQPIPNVHGAPVRLVVPGWPGSLSAKWLNRILLRSTPHDGPGMGGTSYRVPVRPIVPGSRNEGADFADIQSMPVRSVLTNLAHGTHLPAGTRSLDLRGHAWAGEQTVQAVHVSTDFGATWTPMKVAAPHNRFDWQRWSGQATLPSDGYYEVWYRATDSNGRMQPHAAANWNPQGYGGNAVSRAAIRVG